MVSIIPAKNAGEIALKARMSFEYHMTAVVNQNIEAAAHRGEQSCSVKLNGFGMAKFTAKRVEGMLTKAGYKASHAISADGSITMGISWVPSLQEIAPELFRMSEGK